VKFPRQVVWKALLDPGVLSRLIPGIEKFEEVGPDKYTATANLGLPAIKGTYSGVVEIFDKTEPSSYRLRGEGKGTQGWVKGDVQMTLAEVDGGTNLSVQAQAAVGGTIAGVGQRMMEGIAKSMTRDFFKALDVELRKSAIGS
jgi:hypothetical protein